MALLPLTKKADPDDREGDEKKQTNDSADDELNESPLGFFRVLLQWAERKGRPLEVNLGAFERWLDCVRKAGTASASVPTMILMHSRPKEQREAIRNLVHLVLTRDMGTFTAERFKDWIKETDARFRKVGLTLLFDIRMRTVHFTIKEVRTSRTAFRFSSSSHVPFDDRDVVMSVEDFAKNAH
ncbi:MAG: hypothetical protein M3N48_15225 [Verrucomicrobiota bacterium]|nr:hypothetical protein [Verrucomicrobiota bacterium]